MKTRRIMAVAGIVAIAISSWVGASDGAPARAKGRVWEVQPLQGRVVVKVEERGASFARTFRVRRETAIVSYDWASHDAQDEPSLPTTIGLAELSVGDAVVVIYRFDNGRYLASLIETRR